MKIVIIWQLEGSKQGWCAGQNMLKEFRTLSYRTCQGQATSSVVAEQMLAVKYKYLLQEFTWAIEVKFHI